MTAGPVASRRVVSALLVLALSILAAGCTGGDPSGKAAASTSRGSAVKAELDSAKTIEKQIAGAAGGAVDVPLENAVARVIFPAEAIAGNATIAITPYTQPPVAGGKVAVKGFLLEQKGTGAGPKLEFPAWVVVAVKEQLSDGFSLVRYTDAGPEALPTKITRTKTGTVLTALVDHFSGIGGMDVGADDADNARDRFKDFDWVVYVNDLQTNQNGPMKQTVKLTLRAVNPSGDIPGDYTGDATIKTTNDMNAGGGTVKATFSGSSKDVRISVIVGTLAPLTGGSDDDGPLASLTPGEDDGKLAPLVPEPDWSGSGTIKMSAMNVAGTGVATVGGYSASKALGNSSSMPVTLNMWGPQVALEVALPAGRLTFHGFIRGEGKK